MPIGWIGLILASHIAQQLDDHTCLFRSCMLELNAAIEVAHGEGWRKARCVEGSTWEAITTADPGGDRRP
jgi:hypothetical protein